MGVVVLGAGDGGRWAGAVKRWLRWRLGAGLGLEAGRRGLRAMTRFALFCARIGLGALADLDRVVLERYLADLHAELAGRQRHGDQIGQINSFLHAVRQHHWDDTLPGTALVFPEDYPARAQQLLEQRRSPRHRRPGRCPHSRTALPLSANPVDAVDAALTGVGERLRDPSVQASARRTATHVAAAVSASAHAVSHRSRSDPETTDTATDDQPDQKAANTEPEATQRRTETSARPEAPA